MKGQTITFVVAVAFAWTVLGAAQEQPPAPEDTGSLSAETGRSQYRSVHFTITTDFSDDEYAEKLENDLEKYFSRLQKEYWDFIAPPYRESHIAVVVFDAQAAFDTYAEADEGLPNGEKGYSSARDIRIVFLRQDLYSKDVVVVVHELTHLFNRYCSERTPIWLDEGMAQYYANYAGEEAGHPGIVSAINPGALKVVDAALKRGSFAPLSELLRMNDEEFYGAASDVNYAESWALVHYLRKGAPDADTLFARYYALIARGEDGYDAFSMVYGSDREILSRMWLSHLEKLYREHVPLLER